MESQLRDSGCGSIEGGQATADPIQKQHKGWVARVRLLTHTNAMTSAPPVLGLVSGED